MSTALKTLTERRRRDRRRPSGTAPAAGSPAGERPEEPSAAERRNQTMHTWSYQAFDDDRMIQSGAVSAATKEDAAKRIRSLGLRPLTVEKKRQPLLSRELSLPGSKPKVKTLDLAIFARQFSTMVAAGIPLVTALDLVGEHTSSSALVDALDDTRRSVRSGDSLSVAMGRHPHVFDELFTAMIGAGEASGALDDVLARVSVTLERQVAIKSKIRSVLAYPIAVLCLTFAIVVAMLLFVVPVFVGMYEDLEGDLPAPTRIMIGLSEFLRGNVPFIVVAAGAAIYGFLRWKKTESGRRRWDGLKLRAPIVGLMAKRTAMTRFSRTMAVLTRAGIPILDCLALTSRVVENRSYGAAIERVSEEVRAGAPLSTPMEAEKLFPALTSHLVIVGEQTGELDKMLDLLGRHYEDELDKTVESLSSLMEPVLMAVLGAVVGSVVLTLYLPMFKLIELVQ